VPYINDPVGAPRVPFFIMGSSSSSVNALETCDVSAFNASLEPPINLERTFDGTSQNAMHQDEVYAIIIPNVKS
jgi:hypothetical protein